jgi:protein-L-isoaspartate(D-aspartate) O-methyltransferase
MTGQKSVSALLLAVLLVTTAPARSQSEEALAERRKAMVERQVAARGVTDPKVLRALTDIPRHVFVPAEYADLAYGDPPLPIDEGQTISQPYIVGLMTQCLALREGDKVLEIGTGSGYQAAVLALLAGRVWTIEIHEPLARKAAATLARLGLANVEVRAGDGFFGWPEEAPFDAIIITCAVRRVPEPLFEQLAEGGRLVVPLGDTRPFQTLTVLTKDKGAPVVRRVLDVRFVPMTGEAQKKRGPR